MQQGSQSSPPRRFLITGGAGFIGSRVTAELLRDPAAEVAILDNLSVKMPMPAPRERLVTREGDIRSADDVGGLVGAFKPDTIIHLAAVHHIPTCERLRAYALDVNVVGTETVLEAAERAGVSRVVIASSGAVYDWSENALAEDASPLRPCDNYSLAKFTNETQLQYWAARTGGWGRAARIFNTIGTHDPNAHLVPDILAQLPKDASRAEIALGNLSPRRDYIHVEDTARGIVALARDAREQPYDVFNVCSGAEVSVRELVDLIADVVGRPIEVREDAGRKRRVDRPSQCGETAKMKSVLGFKPQLDLRRAIRDIVGQPAVVAG